MTGPDAAVDWQWLAGYRIVRKLGQGSRAAVYLGHAGTAPGHARTVETTVAVKVFEPHVNRESVDLEIEALTTVSSGASARLSAGSAHIVRLLDVSMSALRPRCLVLERLGGGSLAALLGRAQPLSAGMAVTVLVSVVRALEQLHRAGFAQDRIAPAGVIIDGTGRPVLVGLGHLRRLPTQSDAAAAERLADYARFALLVTRVFDAVGDALARDRGEKIADWLAALPGSDGSENRRSAEEIPAEIEDRLFAVARPRALTAHPSAERNHDPGAAHESARGDDGEQRAADTLRRKARARRGRRAAVIVAQGKAEKGAGDAAPRETLSRSLRRFVGATVEAVVAEGVIRHVRARLGAVLRARRRPLIVGGGIGGVLLVLVLALTPPGAAVDNAAANESHGKSHGEPRPSSSPASSADPRATARADPQTAAIAAGDPVAATEALLTRRGACLRTVSLACLDGVDQIASPMLDADQSLIGRLVNDSDASPGQDYADFTVSLIQRSGGSALIALAPPVGGSGTQPGTETPRPASALVIEGETGWRLREILTN